MASQSFDDNVLIPGPSFHIDLAPEDARHPVVYSRRLLIFRCDSTAQRDEQLAALKTALHAFLSQCPFLGGTTAPLPPNEAKDGKEDWRTIVPGQGLELVVRDLSSVMLSFQELEAANFPVEDLPYNLLVPVPQDLGNDRPFAACKMQFSAIAGGTILTFAASHSVADGSGMNELMRILSNETRMASDEARSTSTAKPAGVDRTFLRNISSTIPFNISDHPAYVSSVPAAPSPDQTPHPFAAKSPEIPVLLRISASNLAQLKADATPPDGFRISTHDALGALIWRSVLLIRSRRTQGIDIPPSTISQIFMPSDGRRHLNLPVSYIGNVIYQLTASLDLGTLLSSDSSSGLQAAARSIRQAITAVKPDLVSSYFAELKDRWVHWGFLVGMSTTNVAMGSGFSGAVYGDDWGKAFGPLVSYRNPGEGRGGNWVFPKTRDGSAEVVVGVLPDEVEVLKGDQCFGKYLG
ncbi:hypothetical protein BDZ89DRAFT_1056585 [Hymenopellis radicata]|nr:hypothetical protein BDZ89DRAFT_1056585 [Hymenopellis radicata]